MQIYWRYGATIGLGAVIDLGVAMLVSLNTDAPLPLASASGFAVALVVNYVLFESWVFGVQRRPSLSLRRFIATALAAAAALAARFLVITTFAALAPPSPLWNLELLIASMGCSFVVNYVMVKAIFRDKR